MRRGRIKKSPRVFRAISPRPYLAVGLSRMHAFRSLQYRCCSAKERGRERKKSQLLSLSLSLSKERNSQGKWNMLSAFPGRTVPPKSCCFDIPNSKQYTQNLTSPRRGYLFPNCPSGVQQITCVGAHAAKARASSSSFSRMEVRLPIYPENPPRGG